MDRMVRNGFVGLALVAIGAGGWWWLGCAAGMPTQRIILLARGHAEDDVFVKRFVQAFAQEHADLSVQTKVQAVSVPNEPEAMLNKLQEIARTKPTLWVAQNGRQALTARRAAGDIPLVFSTQADPVALGIASDLLQRSEPSVGLWVDDALDEKRLETLIDAYPSLRRIAVVANAEWLQATSGKQRAMQALAEARGVVVQLLIATTVDEAIEKIGSGEFSRIEAWCLPRTVLSLSGQLGRHLAARGQPVMSASAQDVYESAHLSYAFMPGMVEPTLADLAARVVQGERAGAIPIQMPHRFQFAVRISSDARLPALNPDVVRRADLVVR